MLCRKLGLKESWKYHAFPIFISPSQRWGWRGMGLIMGLSSSSYYQRILWSDNGWRRVPFAGPRRLEGLPLEMGLYGLVCGAWVGWPAVRLVTAGKRIIKYISKGKLVTERILILSYYHHNLVSSVGWTVPCSFPRLTVTNVGPTEETREAMGVYRIFIIFTSASWSYSQRIQPKEVSTVLWSDNSNVIKIKSLQPLPVISSLLTLELYDRILLPQVVPSVLRTLGHSLFPSSVVPAVPFFSLCRGTGPQPGKKGLYSI